MKKLLFAILISLSVFVPIPVSAQTPAFSAADFSCGAMSSFSANTNGPLVGEEIQIESKKQIESEGFNIYLGVLKSGATNPTIIQGNFSGSGFDQNTATHHIQSTFSFSRLEPATTYSVYVAKGSSIFPVSGCSYTSPTTIAAGGTVSPDPSASCSAIDANNVAYCCSTDLYSANQSACENLHVADPNAVSTTNSSTNPACTGANVDNPDCLAHPEKYTASSGGSTDCGPFTTTPCPQSSSSTASSKDCGPFTNTPCAPVVGTSDCSIVGSNNYALCCAGRTADIHADACTLYEDTVEGTIGSGSQATTGGGGTAASATQAPAVQTASNGSLSACYAIKFKSLLDILIWLQCIINAGIIPLIFTVTFLIFMWGIFRFIAATDNTKKEDGKKFIMWGLIGLFVMVGVWGILNIFGGIFGFSLGIPYLQTSSSYLQTNKANTQ